MLVTLSYSWVRIVILVCLPLPMLEDVGGNCLVPKPGVHSGIMFSVHSRVDQSCVCAWLFSFFF